MDIFPSFLDIESKDSGNGGMYEDMSLRIGEVQEILYPEDTRNLSKRLIEYGVYAQHSHNGTTVSKMYNNCFLANPFGGLADKLTWTPRADPSATSGVAPIGVGTKVLLLCVNGQSYNAVILSGIRDQNDNADFRGLKDLGHHLHFNFNGIDISINKDGELIAQYQGKTDADGKTNKDVDSNAPGTAVKFAKDGTLSITTKNESESIVIDHTAGEVRVKTGNNVKIESAGVLTGEATDNTMMGTTYRSAESGMNSQLMSALTQLATSIAAAAAALAITDLGHAAAALTTASTAIVQMQLAVTQFEAGAPSYLSQKNKSD